MKNWAAGLIQKDVQWTRSLLVAQDRHIFVLLLKFFAHSGDSWFWLAGLVFVWLFSEGFWRQQAVFLGVGLAFMAAAVIVLKFTIRRPRPEGEWGQIYRITDPHSFPSGHAARASALAVIGLVLGPPWFAILLILWAPWVSIARVALGIHYLSDVVVGWIVGAVMGLIALAFEPLVLQLLSFLL